MSSSPILFSHDTFPSVPWRDSVRYCGAQKVLVVAGLASSLVRFRGPLLQEMKRQGHEVVACAPSFDLDTRRCLTAWGIQAVEIPLDRAGIRPWRDALTLMVLWRLMRRERPDVVFAYTIKPVIYASLAARFARVPTSYSMVTGAGFAFLGGTWKQRLAGLIARPLYRLALGSNWHVFFQNADDRGLFVDHGLLRSRDQPVLVAGSGVDLDEFKPVAPVLDPPVFLMAARLYSEKGVREYIEAAKQLRAKYPGARFRLAGEPDSNPSAIPASEIERWRAEGIVELLGWVSDIRTELAGCSVYVLPSYREGTPRSVLEAMAVGRPIVTTDAVGCRETVQPGGNGLLVPVKDAGALAAAMERFLVEPLLIASMGQRSRAIAEQRFDVRLVNSVMLSTMGLIRPALGKTCP